MTSPLFECLLCLSVVLLVILLLLEVFDWAVLNPLWLKETWPRGFSFDYADVDGPHAWKILFPESNGTNQSPINITTSSAVVVQPSKPLKCSGFETAPVYTTLRNSQSTVVLEAVWSDSSHPKLEGGPLQHTYEFHSMVFHWGHTDEEGSEHTLDYVRYPMELQVVFGIRVLPNSPPPVVKKCETLAIVSFLFQITQASNPYMDHVVDNLWRITEPQSKEEIPNFPLKWIIPNFDKEYYTYKGSLTQPPCTEAVTWIVYPETIAISSYQVRQFRKIYSKNGPVRSNCRPVQLLNDREVFYYP